jgi:transposase
VWIPYGHEEYVKMLNISELNIKTKKSLIADGQPAFHSKLLLKIYIYGWSDNLIGQVTLSKR